MVFEKKSRLIVDDVVRVVTVSGGGTPKRVDEDRVGLGQVDRPGAQSAATDDGRSVDTGHSLVHHGVLLALARRQA